MSSSNVLTFDIEGFAEAFDGVFRVPEESVSDREERRGIDVNTHRILDLLDECRQTATFFVLGRIGRDMPQLVREIADRGHEVACHSFDHRRLFNLSKSETRAVLRDGKSALEEAAGSPVLGFRAPGFSIIRRNVEVFDQLRALGFLYDSSVYPIGLHDAYGIAGFSAAPFQMENGLVELPMSTARVLGRNIPFGGGGYFRLYPLSLTTALARRINQRDVPMMLYLHPFEIGEVVPRIKGMPILRQLRTYIGIPRVAGRLRRILHALPFCRAIDYVNEHFAVLS